MGKLDQKVALITGATKGIGAAAAKLFVEEGARVVLCGRSEEDGMRLETELNRTGEQKAAFFKLDVTDFENWKRAIAFTEQTFGKLNILINNAGISFRETLEETTPESWSQTLATNQTGVFYGMKLGMAAMAKNGENCAIVSTASIDGKVGDPDFFSYCATKAAVEAMTRCAALEAGQKGWKIRANAVAPGYIITPMAEEDARQNGQTMEEYCRDFIALHPIGRLGTPEDVARAYLYLASDDASFITGTTLMVDGGYTAQ